MRFSSFRARLLTALVGLTIGAQLVTFAVVAAVHRRDAEKEVHRQLAHASDQLTRTVAQRTSDLARGAAALSFDAGLRQALSGTDDAATLKSGVANVQRRIAADYVALLGLDGEVLTQTAPIADAPTALQPIFAAADAADEARAQSFALLGGTLYSIAVVPLRAPDVRAWIAVGFGLDDAFVAGLKDVSGVEVTLLHEGRVRADTVQQPDRFVAEERRLGVAGGEPVLALLRCSWTEKLAPARRLERVLVGVVALSLLAAVAVGVLIARGVSHPVRQLADHSRRVAAGDYTARVAVDRRDELGLLGDALNDMTAGLAERDRVRDLLDKNVSPAIAAQMLRDGVALGGEERAVTVLFADLRGFSTLSEGMPPRALLTLLNRYLDRMTAAVEREGGVVDKFIGDAVMALFGAPVALPDAADRALRAAQGMEAELVALNHELAHEGIGPLGLGIGINTAAVIAGNIGSHRRLNYSVIGDGVNVAARLQALTREPAHDTNVLISADTRRALADPGRYALRELGPVPVKGRAGKVGIHALGRRSEAPG